MEPLFDEPAHVRLLLLIVMFTGLTWWWVLGRRGNGSTGSAAGHGGNGWLRSVMDAIGAVKADILGELRAHELREEGSLSQHVVYSHQAATSLGQITEQLRMIVDAMQAEQRRGTDITVALRGIAEKQREQEHDLDTIKAMLGSG